MFDLSIFARALVPVQRRLVLQLLARADRLALDHLPALWPLTAADVASVVGELVQIDALATTTDPVVPGRPAVCITGAGRRLLAELDDAGLRAAVLIATTGNEFPRLSVAV